MTPDGVITTGTTDEAVKGQTLYAFTITTDAAPADGGVAPFFLKTIDGTDRTQWAIAINTTPANCVTGDEGETTPGTKGSTLYGKFVKGSGIVKDKYRVGVVAGNPGGFPIEEKRTVMYSEWFDGH
jgi:hypothetical protein